ncbi:RNA-directed DNA polymerase, eukaryota, reverse transcriptase zinc-binding domain protein [Tanacetum coccineum]
MKFIGDSKVQICALLETHLKPKSIGKICDRVYGRWNWISNVRYSSNSCRIIVGWNGDNVDVMVVHCCSQTILCLVEIKSTSKKLYISFIYASNSNNDRRILWKELEGHKRVVNNSSWVLMGDFNVTLKPEEHSNGSSIMTGDMGEFRDAINSLEIEDLCSTGFHFTWTKSLHNPQNSILKKLDRIMMNDDFLEQYGQAHGIFLPFMVSDHSPSMLIIPKIHGNLFEKTVELKEKLKEAQRAVEEDPFNTRKKEIAALLFDEYSIAAEDEITFLHQKMKIKWLSEGDRNTAYFHKVLKARKHKCRVESICGEDGQRFNGNDVLEQFVKHFNKFLGVSVPVSPLSFIELIIGDELCLAVKEFFNSGRILGEINATLIALVPKIDTPNRVSDFRPIACCNVLYKIISKILTNRIKPGLNKIVSLNQSAFVPGRHIQDNILITQELLRGYNRKSGAKRCAMKIDLQKAYDTINWEFLKEVLQTVGFHDIMINWIMTCITTASFSICVNGEIKGFFKGGRGLRQGDPISPYLFTLVMEVFNMIMIKNVQEAENFKYHYGCSEIKLTHMCFADDLMVLCNGDSESLKVVKKSLDEFSRVSGLYPNLSKSTIFFGNIPENIKCEMLKILPFSCGKLPMRYLGVPLLAKRLGVKDCASLIDNQYWASVYLLPDAIFKKLERIFKSFLWNARGSAKGKARVKNDAKLSDLIFNGNWIWPDEWGDDFPELNQLAVPNLNQNGGGEGG